MKKLIALIFALFFILSFTACGERDGGESTDTYAEEISKSIDTEADIKSPEPELYPARYIRTDGYREGVDFPYTVSIGSVSELDDYIEANGEHYNLGHKESVYSDTTIGFADAIEEYDEEFFADNMLVMAVLEEGSGSIRHELAGVTADDFIQIKRITPDFGTCDMAEWHIIIEMPRERAEGHSFTAEYYGEDNRDLAVFSYNFVYMSARVPKGWEYDIKEYDGSAEEYQQIGLEFYPAENRNVRVKLYFSTGFLGLCGTGLISERVSINGYDAWHYRYEDMRDWHLYCFDGLPGEYSLEISGAGQAKYEKDIAEILETLELFGGEYISEDEAIELAKSECTVEYDRARAEFDFINGLWRVNFSKNMTAGGDQTVKLYINGKYHSSEYGE